VGTSWRSVALLLVLVAALGGFFLTRYLGESSNEVAGVVKEIPPGTVLEDVGSAGDADAARTLLRVMEEHPDRPRYAVRFRQGDKVVHLLADLERDSLNRWSTAGRTLLDETFEEDALGRLQWAADHGGDLAAPGLPEPVSRNLYH
jgi:hypothetical protein